ncbi:MAG: retroviral-like aspartic protease family protein [Candidatus Rokubacteria bacterium]|nr:retroviral-like aspartic protease family protein [Candidatus Rokubacteria bacterium]
MGTFRVAIELGDPTGTRWVEVETLVDTGATYTSVPANILADLGVVPHVRARFVLADGHEVERDIGHAWLRIGEASAITLVVFAEPGAPVLLGAYALEGLRLAADPVARRLVPVSGYLLTA